MKSLREKEWRAASLRGLRRLKQHCRQFRVAVRWLGILDLTTPEPQIALVCEDPRKLEVINQMTSKKELKAKVRSGPCVTVCSVPGIYLSILFKYSVCCAELTIDGNVKAAIMVAFELAQ